MKIKITTSLVRKILKVIKPGLTIGMGNPEPGKMCVEAAICYALDLPHSDDPQCVHDDIRYFKIALNDCNWSSNEARANGLRQLSIAQLNSKGESSKPFKRAVAFRAVNTILPEAFNNIYPGRYDELIKQCKEVKTLSQYKNVCMLIDSEIKSGAIGDGNRYVFTTLDLIDNPERAVQIARNIGARIGNQDKYLLMVAKIGYNALKTYPGYKFAPKR